MKKLSSSSATLVALAACATSSRPEVVTVMANSNNNNGSNNNNFSSSNNNHHHSTAQPIKRLTTSHRSTTDMHSSACTIDVSDTDRLQYPPADGTTCTLSSSSCSSSSQSCYDDVERPLTTSTQRNGGRIPWVVVDKFPRGGGQGSNSDNNPSAKNTQEEENNATSEKSFHNKGKPTTKKKKNNDESNKSYKQKPVNGDENINVDDDNSKHAQSVASKDKNNSKKDAKKKDNKHDSNSFNNTNKKKANSKNKTGTAAPPPSNVFIEEILQHDDYYDVLGVTHTASERDIQKAYRKRCVQAHPDKTGGDRRAFDKVAEAYDILSDPLKRQAYNRYGKSMPMGLGADGSAAAAASGSYQDLFRTMFQQAQEYGLRRQQAQQQRRNRTLRYQLQVTLEDLYMGKTETVVVTPPYHPHNDHYHQQHNHGSNRQQQKQVDVHIPKGSHSGQSIVMSGEVDFHDDTTPGDMIFILTQVPHPTFTRKGHDLAMELTIDLEEAICGVRRPIQHLDGTDVWIESAIAGGETNSDTTTNTANTNPHVIIRTGDVQVLKGWGMPKRNRNDEYGDLYIQYRVEMPHGKGGMTLTETERIELSRLLTKLQGTNHLLHHRGSGNSSNKHKKKMRMFGKDGNDDGNLLHQEGVVHTLMEAKTSDFGTASGTVHWDEEDYNEGIHPGMDHGDEFHPFASAASNFFGQSSDHRGRTSSSRFYFGGNFGGGNPFFGGGNGGGDDPDPYGEDDGNVQCQHM